VASVLFLMPLGRTEVLFRRWVLPSAWDLKFPSKQPLAGAKGGEMRRARRRGSLNCLDVEPGTLTAVFFGILGEGDWGLDARVVLKGRSQMPAPPRRLRLGAEQRRALQLAASSLFGVSEATMFAQGCKRRMLASLIRAGLGIAQREDH